MVNNPKDLQGSTVSIAPHDEGALLFRAKNGDADAVHSLLAQYQGLVYKLANSFENVPDGERDDLCQEGMITLHKAILFYDASISAFSTFAYHCVKRSMLSFLKAMNRRTPTVPYEELEQVPGLSTLSPEEVAIDRENCEAWLRRFDEVLSEYENRVLGLFLSGKSTKDAAIILEKSEKSVSNALTRAKQKLSSLLS